MKQNNLIIGLGIVAILLLGVMVFQVGQKDIVIQQPGQSGISVTGSADLSIMPDQAKIVVSVETERDDVKVAQDINTANSNKLMDALKAAGIKEADIATTGYNIYDRYRYREDTTTKYVVDHTIEITVNDISKVGEILELAVKNGANNVNNVRFTLSEELEEDARAQLLEQASEAAEDKAKAIAKELSVNVGKVVSVSENSYNPPIYYARAESFDMVASSAPEIAPEQVDVRVQLNVVFAVN